MERQIFRKKNLENITSPEQLNEYIRLKSPGKWLVLSAIIVLMTGFFVWGILGRLDTQVTVASVAKGGTMTTYIRIDDIDKVKQGMRIVTEGENEYLRSVSEDPIIAESDIPAYAFYLGGFKQGEWVYCSESDTEHEDGVYSSYIIIESVAPISLLIPAD